MHFMHYEPSTLSPLCDTGRGVLRAVRALVLRLVRPRGKSREYAMVPLREKTE